MPSDLGTSRSRKAGRTNNPLFLYRNQLTTLNFGNTVSVLLQRKDLPADSRFHHDFIEA